MQTEMSGVESVDFYGCILQLSLLFSAGMSNFVGGTDHPMTL